MKDPGLTWRDGLYILVMVVAAIVIGCFVRALCWNLTNWFNELLQ